MTVTTPVIPDPGIATATANCEPETTTTTTTTTSTTNEHDDHDDTATGHNDVAACAGARRGSGPAATVQVLGAAVVRVSPNFAG